MNTVERNVLSSFKASSQENYTSERVQNRFARDCWQIVVPSLTSFRAYFSHVASRVIFARVITLQSVNRRTRRKHPVYKVTRARTNAHVDCRAIIAWRSLFPRSTCCDDVVRSNDTLVAVDSKIFIPITGTGLWIFKRSPRLHVGFRPRHRVSRINLNSSPDRFRGRAFDETPHLPPPRGGLNDV